jgi:hypothetical protein
MKLTSRGVSMTVACVALALSSCSADGGVSSPAAGLCKAHTAQGLVGKPKPTDEAAMHAPALASFVRSRRAIW